MSSYTIALKYGSQYASTKTARGAQILQFPLGVFNKTIIALALVGYEIVIANTALRASLAIYHFISNARLWDNC